MSVALHAIIPPTPTIAVIGAGAVGLYYGGRLAQHGLATHFLTRSDHVHLRAHGLHVRSHHGDFSLPASSLHLHASPSTMPPADVVLVSLKTTANHTLEQLLPPLLKSTTVVITLQNGLGNEEALARFHDPSLIYGGIAFTCINRVYTPGETVPLSIHHTSHGLIRLGAHAPPATGDSQLATLWSLLSACKIECQRIPNLMHARWQKLIWNVPFNGLGAALDLATDQLLASDTGTELVSRLMHEIMAASAALGMPFEDPESIVEHQLLETRAMARYHTSMQLDRRHGRPLEHEAIVGQPLRRGTAAGALMRETQRLYELLCLVDGQLKMG